MFGVYGCKDFLDPPTVIGETFVIILQRLTERIRISTS